MWVICPIISSIVLSKVVEITLSQLYAYIQILHILHMTELIDDKVLSNF
jgi:hypothetical protein